MPCVLVALFVTLLAAIAPNQLFHPLGSGIDPSWRLAINLAVDGGRTFGRDFIWPYGPLAVVATRLPIGVGKMPILLADLFLIASFGFAVAYAFRRLRKLVPVLIASCVVLSLAAAPVYSTWLDNVLFLMFLFMLFHCMKHGSLVTLGWACLTAAFAFFVKVTVGFATNGILGLFFLVSLLRPNRFSRRTLAVFLVVHAGAIAAGSVILNAPLLPYVEGMTHLLVAFSDSMSIPAGNYVKVSLFLGEALVVLSCFLVVVMRNRRAIRAQAASGWRHLFVAAFLFLLFKNTFVRPGAHEYIFATFAPAALGLLVLFESGSTRRRLASLFVLVLLIRSVVTAWTFRLDPRAAAPPPFLLAGILGAAALLGVIYLRATPRRRVALTPWFGAAALAATLLPNAQPTVRFVLHNYAALSSYAAELLAPPPEPPRVATLTADVLERIGRRTVDVFPSEITHVWRHGLRYRPRPVPQTWSAYDEFLDRKNHDMLLSDEAPEVVLFTPGDIDGRHPFFTEGLTKLALLRRYDVTLETSGVLVLERSDRIRDTVVARSETGVGIIGRPIELGDDRELCFGRFETEYTWLGRLRSLLYQAPLLEVTIELEDGEKKTFRAIPGILRSGTIVNRIAEHATEAAPIFASRGRNGRKVRRMTLHTPQPWGFRERFDFTLQSLAIDD